MLVEVAVTLAKTESDSYSFFMSIATLELPGRARHSQARSRKTAERIIAAAREMIEEGPFAEVSVAEIVRRSGTSIGGFYARFKNKETLLELMLLSTMDEAAREFEQMVHDLGDRSAAEFINAWARTLVSVYRTHRTIIREVMATWPLGLPAASRAQTGSIRLRDHARESFRTELKRRSNEITRENPDEAISVALMMGTTTLREAIVGGASKGYGLDDDQVAREVADCLNSYLGLQ